MLTDAEVRARYGTSVRITRKCGFVLVHLDQPPAAVAAARTDAFEPADYFDPECPLCAVERASGVVVFDGDDGEEIFIE